MGCIALVGSTTNVHSASGSAFVKVLVDGILYRNATLGEALRDARNYFFCLADLKVRRGHSQQAKACRVSLSFRLWGDPELRVFPRELRPPRRPPPKAAWEENGKLRVTLPGRRLPTARTQQYLARLFPGAEAAGIVKRLKKREARRISPIYYFRLKLPAGFAADDLEGLVRDGQATTRGVFRLDDGNRFLHGVYFPCKETRNEDFLLRLTE